MAKEAKEVDLFDEIELEDIFDSIQLEDTFDVIKPTNDLTNVELVSEIKDFVKDEIKKAKPVTIEVIRNVHVPSPTPPPPPQPVKEIVREVIIREEKPKKEAKTYAEKEEIERLNSEISDLKKELAKTREVAERPIFVPGGPGVIGIPPPEPNPTGHVLTVNGDRKAEWKEASGGSSISGYTINDATTLKNLPADASLDDIRQVLGTLLAELQA